MIFFKRENAAPAGEKQPKPQSVLGILLNPRIGASMRPLGENINIFVNLIALLFASFRLFPSNHPALIGTPGVPQLTLSQVISAAWNSLRFTKDDLPRVLFFFAVVGSLAFGVLALILGGLSLFIGHAHAQPVMPPAGGYFGPVDPTNDIAIGWLQYIFNGVPMMNYLNQYGQVVPQSTVIQGALMAALGLYSSAILVVAAVILFYHLASMVVETAHHGVVMGKRANQIWAPIRLVVAIGLLVPLGTGMNTGQYLVVKVAELGSGLASQVWSAFVMKLASETYKGVVPNTPYVRKTVYDMVMMKACACAYNSYAGHGNTCGMGAPPAGTPQCTAAAQGLGPGMLDATMSKQGPQTLTGAGGANPSQRWIYDLATPILSENGACGHYVFPAMPTPDPTDSLAVARSAAIVTARTTALSNMETAVDGFIRTYMPAVILPCAGGKSDQPFPMNTGAFEQLVRDYQNQLQTAFANGAASDFSAAMHNVAMASSAQGWVSAGAIYNTTMRAQEVLMDTDGLLPGTQAPNMPAVKNSQFQNIIPSMMAFQRWMQIVNPAAAGAAPAAAGGISNQQYLMDVAAGLHQENNGSKEETHLMDKIFGIIDWLAGWNKVWTPFASGATNVGAAAGAVAGLTPQNFTLGVQFTGANPLAEIAAFGHANINVAYDIFDEYITFLEWSGSLNLVIDGATKLAGNATQGKDGGAVGLFGGILGNITKEAASGIGSMIGLICLVFFSSGFLMAFLLPMIPFFRFLFGILTWIVAVMEAVVCIPCVALGLLNPEGEGFAGPNGKTAYYFLFSIFLRPVMMVFGLIVSVLIFFVAASCMNMLYMLAIKSSGGLAHGHLMLTRLVCSFMYAFVLYMCGNNASKTISWFPEHAVKWMGGQSMHFQNMGDPGELAQPMTLASGYAEREIIQGAGKLSGPSAIAAKGLLTGRINGEGINQLNQAGHGVARAAEDALPGQGGGGGGGAIPRPALPGQGGGGTPAQLPSAERPGAGAAPSASPASPATPPGRRDH